MTAQKKLYIRKTTIVLALIFTSVFSVRSFAQQKPDSQTDLFEMSIEELMNIPIIISASKYEQPIDKSPMAINVLTAEDIQMSGAKTIADLLKRFPGVWSWTKTRTDQDIGLMGITNDDSSRALFLLDGQPISTPMFEGMQWPQFPITLEEVERIEILRGGGSALYGANAFTGVINIITKSAKDRNNVFNSYVGEGGIHNHTATIAHTIDKLSLAFTGGWRQTHNKGDFDPVYNLGEQDYYSTPVLNTKIEYDISENQKTSFFSGYSIGDGGYPASPGDPSIDRVKDWEDFIIQGQYVNTALKDTEINLKTEYFRIDQQNFKPYQIDCPEKYHVIGERYNLEAYATTKLIPRNVLLAGTTYQTTMTDSIGIISNLDPGRKHSYDLYGFFIQNEYNIADPLSLIGSCRYDIYNDIENMFTARGTAMYYINQKNTLRFSVGNSYRRPDIYGMYYYVQIGSTGYYKGSGPEAPPQKAVNYELEYRTYLIPRHTVKVELFHSKFENFLHNTFAPGPIITVVSSDNKYLIQGLICEIEGFTLKKTLKWYANFTYYDAKDTTANLKMVDVPDYMFNVGLQYFPTKNLYLSADLHYQDGCKAVADSSITDDITGIPAGTSIKPYSTVDAKIGYSPKKNVEISVSVENLFNDRHYEFPSHLERGRTLYIGARIIW